MQSVPQLHRLQEGVCQSLACRQWAGLWTCMGRNKTLLPITSLPVIGEIAGVNMASLGMYLHSTKTRARWVEGFHDELNGHVFDLACDSPYDENKQPYHTGLVATQVNKDHAFRHTPGRTCQVCYWCIIEDSWKRQHHQGHMECKDTKSCRETPGLNTRNGQVQMSLEHPWTL